MNFLAHAAFWAAAAAGALEGGALPSSVSLSLPRVPGVSAEWLIPPAARSAGPTASARFAVDPQGEPWLGYRDGLLIDLASLAIFRLDRPLDDFAWIGKGSFVACSDSALGSAEPIESPKPNREDPFPVLGFSPAYRLDYEECRLSPGRGDTTYWTVKARGENRYEVYLLRDGGTEKLFVSPERIEAVAGDAAETHVAIGDAILRLQGGKTVVELKLPRGKIRAMVEGPRSGLFYATDTEVGFVGTRAAYSFLEARSAQLRRQGDSLYVYLPETRAVLRISGIEVFDRLEF